MKNERSNTFPIVTLCGSTKFYKEYMFANRMLTLENNIVLHCPIFSQSRDKEWWETLSEKEREDNISLLRQLHNFRIELCDAIFVVNPDNYIGESTREEIEYARSKGKGVMYMYDKDGRCVFDQATYETELLREAMKGMKVPSVIMEGKIQSFVTQSLNKRKYEIF